MSLAILWLKLRICLSLRTLLQSCIFNASKCILIFKLIPNTLISYCSERFSFSGDRSFILKIPFFMIYFLFVMDIKLQESVVLNIRGVNLSSKIIGKYFLGSFKLHFILELLIYLILIHQTVCENFPCCLFLLKIHWWPSKTWLEVPPIFQVSFKLSFILISVFW